MTPGYGENGMDDGGKEVVKVDEDGHVTFKVITDASEKVNEAIDYAKKIDTTVTDKTEKISITKKTSDGYDIVGPFKYNFSEKVKITSIGTNNGENISNVYNNGSGTTSKKVSDVKSGKSFYIKTKTTGKKITLTLHLRIPSVCRSKINIFKTY